ncbi:ABC transporter ATP-binding protein [Azospirillum fermentarium]|uniref:ABC transporter ATP-binding protein n=1 Tax=Azospirillum fermentarium TaxID=1233114 RepID=UPI0022265176|nr:ABC transporter ATP-binding protein [Azospirillum fermentarium]
MGTGAGMDTGMGGETGGGFLHLGGIRKCFRQSTGRDVTVLNDVDLSVAQGESLAICGPSGSGKTTLLAIVGLLMRADAGTYRLDGEPLEGLSRERLAALRTRCFGFVFQDFHLVPHLPVAENVAMPLHYAKVAAPRRRGIVMEVLERVQLAELAGAFPSQLSGGQKQRVALARALINDPKVLLADEPTGNLDPDTGQAVFDLIAERNRAGTTTIIVTHNPAIAAQCGRAISVSGGRIAEMPRE